MKLKYGVGTLDVKGASKTKAYKVWNGMLKRCYSKNDRSHKTSYRDCTVCNEWLLYSNFEKWYNNNYIDGYSIDKDLLGDYILLDTKVPLMHKSIHRCIGSLKRCKPCGVED